MTTHPSKGHSRLSVLQGILPLEPSQIPAEVIGGVTLAALAIPEVMGYTQIAGTPVITGLYTILIPAVLFALFGSSRHLVVGADSATAAILAANMVGIASRGSDEYVALASLLALMSAGFLILARLIRLGVLADFLSRTVLIGFLTGVGIHVSLSQIPGILGTPAEKHALGHVAWDVIQQNTQVNIYNLSIALTVLAFVASLKWVSPRVPGALICVVSAIVFSWAFDWQQHVPVLGVIPSGLPTLGLPKIDWSFHLISSLVPTAFSMFVVILAQSAATSRAYAARYDEQFSENTDLVGLAMANLGAGLSGTFVVNGSPTKTQMLYRAGGRTQLSLLVMGLVVLFVLLFLTKTLAYMPNAVLSAVVFLIGIDLIDLKGMLKVFRQRRSEFWVALITLLTVVLVGVEQGILLAMVLSLIDHTRHGYRPKNAVLVPTESGIWRPLPVETATEAVPGLIIYRFTHSMYYANSQQLSDELMMLANAAQPNLRWLCLDASATDDVDFTAAEALRSIIDKFQEEDIRLVIAQILNKEPGKGLYGLRELVGPGAYYDSLEEVLADYRKTVGV